MPRKTKKVIIIPPEEQNLGPVFELVVKEFKGLLPGSKGYDPKQDRLLLGWQYGSSVVPSWTEAGTKVADLSPYDFLTDPATNRRVGHPAEPNGTGAAMLTNGVGTWSDIPPVFIWNNGMWLSDAIWHPSFDLDELPTWIKKKVVDLLPNWPKDGVPPQIYQFWITSGEGTSGNNLYRTFELPDSMCKQTPPKHPKDWPDHLKRSGSVSSWSYSSETKSASVTKEVTIPAGVRYRCADCGHWFTQADLVGHNMVCGKGEYSDWAMMCHSDCGCRTLDEASQPKEGFPRPKPVVEEAQDELPEGVVLGGETAKA